MVVPVGSYDSPENESRDFIFWLGRDKTYQFSSAKQQVLKTHEQIAIVDSHGLPSLIPIICAWT